MNLYGPSFVALHLNLYELVWIADYIKFSQMFIVVYELFYGVSVKYMNCMEFLFDLGYHIRDRNNKTPKMSICRVQ